ncbi:MAG: hypothetical protein H6974_10945 [Gammaproteobacteria bacterium]|nr:hypothetical protein [Gammaproteobacteria bacterium]
MSAESSAAIIRKMKENDACCEHSKPYFIVHEVGIVTGEWFISGIFSKKEDAEAYIETRNADPIGYQSACLNQMTMEDIKTTLAAERMMTVNATIERLLKQSVNA